MAEQSGSVFNRKQARLDVTPKADIHDVENKYKALIQDVSDTGLAFVCSRSWPSGKLVDLTIYFPQGIVTAEIEIRHSTDIGTGARFTFMDDISRGVYEKFMLEYYGDHLAKSG